MSRAGSGSLLSNHRGRLIGKDRGPSHRSLAVAREELQLSSRRIYPRLFSSCATTRPLRYAVLELLRANVIPWCGCALACVNVIAAARRGAARRVNAIARHRSLKLRAHRDRVIKVNEPKNN